jgi:hypothetical protein
VVKEALILLAATSLVAAIAMIGWVTGEDPFWEIDE